MPFKLISLQPTSQLWLISWIQEVKVCAKWRMKTNASNRCLLTSALSTGHLKMSLKKALKTAIKRELASYLTAQFSMSLRQACRTLYFYQSDTRRVESMIQVLTELAERYPRYGFLNNLTPEEYRLMISSLKTVPV